MNWKIHEEQKKKYFNSTSKTFRILNSLAAKIVFTHTHHIELRTRSRQRYSEDFWKLPPKQDYVIIPIMALQIFENEMGVLASLSNVSYFTFTYLVDRNIIGDFL